MPDHNVHPTVTTDQVKNSVVFKATERALKNEFPWVIGLEPPSEEDINTYNLIFCRVVVNPFLMSNYIGLPLQPWVLRKLLKKEGDRYPTYMGSILDMEYDDTKETMDQIENIFEDVQKSPVIPTHLKLPKSRKLNFSSFTYPPNLSIPKEYLMDPDELSRNAERIRTTS